MLIYSVVQVNNIEDTVLHFWAKIILLRKLCTLLCYWVILILIV